MRAPPIPSATHNRLKRGKLRLPIQIALDTARARHQHGRIAGTPRHFTRGNRMSRYAANGFYNLANAKTAAGAKIVDELVALAQRIQHQNMRAGQVAHVNVITDAGAIRSGIVGSEDGDGFALSERHLQRQGNQVRLGHMILAQMAGGSRRVEIAEAGITQAMDKMKPN